MVSRVSWRPLLTAASVLCLMLPGLSGVAAAADDVAGRLVIFKKNGGWCWFQDERAIVYREKLIFGSVAGVTRDGSTAGDVEVTSYDLGTEEQTFFKLHEEFQVDDHDAPAFLLLSDDRILATYTTHGGTGTDAETDLMRWRITAQPGDTSDWLPERIAPVGDSVSYSNLLRLKDEENRIYNFHRGIGFDPNYLVSDDDGDFFYYKGRLLAWDPVEEDPKYSGIDGSRPYLKYISNGRDTIHFVSTEDHPRAYDNSIYHGYIRGGTIYRSDGTEVGPLATNEETSITPEDLTRIFEGNSENVAWTIDLHIDTEGMPYTVFSVQKDSAAGRGSRDSGGEDHRYYHARWDGEKWRTHEIAYAGSFLYPGEQDYTGLAALDPMDPYSVYISTDANPESGYPLVSVADGKRHYEIFHGISEDQGKSWKWRPITWNSSSDNLRPLVPIWDDDRVVLLWLLGTYRRYQDYDQDVVGLIMKRD